MAGMHMDKGGGAAFAGFVKTVSLLKPKGLKVVAEIAFVRNSSGSDNYVSDEIIRYRHFLFAFIVFTQLLFCFQISCWCSCCRW